ncbi:MAG: alginate export family protein [Gemmatimonadota bacterium]|nr:alginate export family protein [Gemmatimonadota bacterium]
MMSTSAHSPGRWALAAGLRRSVVSVAIALLLPLPAAAQNLTFSGQVRPRYEYRDPVAGGLDDFTSMRVRFGLDAEIEPGLSIFVEAQDVRIWGGETHPLFDFSADAFDLHQGYLRYQGEDWNWLTSTIGRMETNLGGQRLLGAVDWTQQGQSFDGLRFDIETDRTHWVFLGFTVNDDTAPGIADDRELYGVYTTVDDVGPGMLDVYWLYDRISGAAESDEQWLGARYVVGGEVFGRVEATFDTGTRDGADVRAYLLGARVGTTFADGRVTATLWYDYLSGDDPATADVEVFNTLFATNHKFYGFADLFLNIPAHTGGAGLQDLALKLAFQPGGAFSAGVDLHSFRAAEQGTLTETRFGEELDLTLTHRYSEHLSATAGLGYVWQAEGFAEIGRLGENMTWIYVMMNASF